MTKRNTVSRKFIFAVLMCIWLVAGAMATGNDWIRLALMGMAVVVCCVWMMCEARVDCAAAPLDLPPLRDERVDKPPEGDAD